MGVEVNTVAYASAVPVEERDGERCVPHTYTFDSLLGRGRLQAENARLRARVGAMRAACLEVVEKEAAGYKEFNDGAAALFVVASRIAALPLAEEAALEG